MPGFSAEVSMPSYVLKDGSQPIGPVLETDSATVVTVTYSFSGRRVYDAFSAQSSLRLAPYPLTKGYLRNQVNESSEQLRLLAIDALSPRAAEFHATTMQSVLSAIEKNSSHVEAEYLFVFNEQTASYRLTTSPNDSPLEKTETTNLT